MYDNILINTLQEDVDIFSKQPKENKDDEGGESGTWFFKADSFSIHCRINRISINLNELSDVIKLLELMALIEENPAMFGSLDDFIKMMDKITQYLFRESLYDFISNRLGQKITWEEAPTMKR